MIWPFKKKKSKTAHLQTPKMKKLREAALEESHEHKKQMKRLERELEEKKVKLKKRQLELEERKLEVAEAELDEELSEFDPAEVVDEIIEGEDPLNAAMAQFIGGMFNVNAQANRGSPTGNQIPEGGPRGATGKPADNDDGAFQNAREELKRRTGQ